MDHTETIRRTMVTEINSNPGERESLEIKHGRVYDTNEVGEKFTICGFGAPFVVAIEKETGKKCTLMFQHDPRFYWFDRYV